MDSAKKHYSSLFFLPSFAKSLLAVAVITIGAVTLCSDAVLHTIGSLTFGIAVFVVTIIADLITSKVVLKGDPLFNPRITLAMSFYSWSLLLAFIAHRVGLG